MTKTDPGNFFEDFTLNLTFDHGRPRTLGDGEAALYTALYGSRFPLHGSEPFAKSIGYPAAPLDDFLVFHVVFGKTVPDISLNAVANLGYANCVFGAPVYSGDSISASSTVIGLRETSNRKTGVVYVRTTGVNQRSEMVLDYVRWVMVPKRDPNAPAAPSEVPALPETVAPEQLRVPDGLRFGSGDGVVSPSPVWGDYSVGERIDHLDGTTIEAAEHQMAARLYHNTARVHFNQHVEKDGRFGRRIVYGGHIISIARALSFNGLANAFHIAAINGGSHTAPSFAGDTIYAWSEVLEKIELPGRDDLGALRLRDDLGALRLRTVATKDHACADFPLRDEHGKHHPAVVLNLDYTVLMPRCR